MRALVVDAAGAPLRQALVERPAPGPGEALVRIHASGLNPLDTKIRAGRADHARHPLPAVLGIDMAGVVEAVGPGVTEFIPGDEVYGMSGGVGGHQGSLAEFASVDAELLAHKPRSLTSREAAALPLVVITAWEGLVDRARVQAGHRVLIHGGAGGIGAVAIQIARARGAVVFATGTAAQQVLMNGLGATAIDFAATSVEQYVEQHTAGEGFDVIFDTVGGATLDASFGAVRAHTGHVVSALGWGTHSLAPLSFRGATYSGIFTLLPLLTGKGRAHHGAILRMAARLVEDGRLRPVLDPRRLTWETVSDGFAAIEAGSATGKLVVDIIG
ncbi:MAG: zinc-dependent alcohol dehydrogenase family protein [Deltaproteobacteria bacterium]|nr:zinc-dependent alcohol dehydrogenase family protein [Deltaproteobacteria bacterium]